MKNKQKLSLFVFIDAFGWEISKQHPFLDDFLTARAPLGTLLGYSCTCDPTILTGKLPQDHGHFSFFFYNPAGSPFSMCRFLNLLPKSITRRGRVRHLMSRFVRRWLGYTGYFQLYNMPFHHLPLFDYSEKRDLYYPGGINAGCPTIFDHLRDNHIPFHLSDWRLPETENLKSLELSLQQGQIKLAYLFLADMDALLHAQGTGSPAVGEKIAWYERRLRAILEAAQRHYDPIHLFVFSDHGMTDVQESCDLIARIDSLGLRFGTDYAAVYDSTMARFWFLREPARDLISQALQAEPLGRILTREQLSEYGCYFPDHKYGELFFLMDPGVLICPSFMGETMLAGMHGYDPDHKDSLAMVASNASTPLPQSLAQICDLMKREVEETKPPSLGYGFTDVVPSVQGNR